MAKLVYTDGMFLFQCAFDERHLAKAAGFRWDNERKVWYTLDHAVAVRLREYGTESAQRKINSLLLKKSPWTSPHPPLPQGLSLLPHQLPAIQFALEQNRSYLGLDPGLGKTIIAARIAATLCDPVVYICPPFLTRNVEEEFKKWAPALKVARYDKSEIDKSVQVIIVPDSLLIRPETRVAILLFVGEQRRAVLFVDEAHRYKNEEAKRTRALLGDHSKHRGRMSGIVDAFTKQIYMSGTPVPNRPMELYPILSKAAPETIDFMNRFDYGRKYCDGYRNNFGWDFSGASRVEELARRVIVPTGPFMLRLKKSLLDLPPKLEEVFIISDDMSPKLTSMNMRIEKQYKSTDDLMKARIASERGMDTDDLPIATYRRLLGEEKASSACEYIASLLEETDENILVFAFHKETVGRLVAGLHEHRPLVVTGDTPMAERHACVKEFQSSNRRLIIGNYLALGTGFTLTKANRVIFVEFSWVPGDNEQASDRAHRIGQKSTVFVQYMVYQHSIDKKVIETILRKRKTTEQI